MGSESLPNSLHSSPSVKRTSLSSSENLSSMIVNSGGERMVAARKPKRGRGRGRARGGSNVVKIFITFCCCFFHGMIFFFMGLKVSFL